MKKDLFLELIRQVKAVSGIEAPIIVGSHTLYAVSDHVPDIVRTSVEADFLFAGEGRDVLEKTRRELGLESVYHGSHGLFADILGLATVTLPPGWKERLQPLVDENGEPIARCLDLYDAAVSKLMAGRDKDWPFLFYLLDEQHITLPALMERAVLILETAADGALQPRLEKFLANLQRHHTRYDLTPLHQLIQQLKSR